MVLKDSPTGVENLEWSPLFLDELYASLIALAKSEGVHGWHHARWVVYDEVIYLLAQYNFI